MDITITLTNEQANGLMMWAAGPTTMKVNQLQQEAWKACQGKKNQTAQELVQAIVAAIGDRNSKLTVPIPAVVTADDQVAAMEAKIASIRERQATPLKTAAGVKG